MVSNKRNNRSNITRATRFVTAKQVQNMLKSRTELKRYTATSSGSFTTGGAFIYKSPVGEADDYFDRTGIVIRPVSYDQRLVIADSVSSYSRVITFQDTMAFGAAPAVTDVLASAATNSQYNPINKANRRFKILSDNMVTASSGGELIKFTHDFVKMAGEINFIGSGTTSASAGKNSIFTLIIGQTVTATYDLKTELTYTDV